MKKDRKWRRIVSALLVVLMVTTLLPSAGWAAEGDVEGSQEPQTPTATGSWADEGSYDISWYTGHENDSSYTLTDAEDLAGLAKLVNEPMVSDGKFMVQVDFSGKTVTLEKGAKIDLSSKQWVPIGAKGRFKGTFDGNGATITGLTIGSEEEPALGDVGLFGGVNGGSIKNVTITDANIYMLLEKEDEFGGVAASVYGRGETPAVISNCSVSGNLVIDSKIANAERNFAGGIVGEISGQSVTVENCVNNATIQSNARYTGGIAGSIDEGNTIRSCTNKGQLQSTAHNQKALGGIAGYTEGSVEKCTNEAALTSAGNTSVGDADFLGGIAGVMSAGNVADCTNNGTLTSPSSTRMGGIVGALQRQAESSITDSHNTAALSNGASGQGKGTSTGGILGGFYGQGGVNSLTIERCSNTAPITGSSETNPAYGGGILGNGNNEWKITLAQCYNAGDVTIAASTEGGALGGLVGSWQSTADGGLINCYNVGKVTNSAEQNVATGGLIGQIPSTTITGSQQASITDCYQAGAVASKGSDGLDAVVGHVGGGITVNAVDTHYWSGCGPASAYGASQPANTLTEDDSWSTALGFDTSIWEKATNPTTPQDGKMLGLLPVLSANKQSPAPTLERTTDKEVQEAFSITGKPEQVHQNAAPFTLGTTGGSGSGAVTWTITNGTEAATVDATGTVTLKPDATGRVTVTATKAGDDTYLPAQDTYTFEIVTDPINAVTITGLKVPVVGESPVSTFDVPEGARYWAPNAVGGSPNQGTVEWTPRETNRFTKDGQYTAIFRVKPNENYKWAELDDITVNLDGINMDFVEGSVKKEIVDGNNLGLTVTFKPTTHSHDFDNAAWTADAMNHWHACKNDGCPLFPSAMPGHDKHIDANGVCGVCGNTIGYTIAFDANGGNCDTTSARTDLAGKIHSLPNAKRNGYTFLGWFDAKSGGEQVMVDNVYTANTTLYAHWEKIPEPPYTGKYSYEIFTDEPKHGDIDVDRYATEGEKVTFTLTGEDGYAPESVTITTKGGKEIDVIDNGDGTYSFKMPSGDVTIAATFAEVEKPEPTPELPFTDVSEEDWFYDPVAWAYGEGFMTGTSATEFSPNLATTRGMIVSILHRLEGSPAADNAGFNDVADGAWYADAVNWAASKDIVAGYSATTFAPNAPITREQLAAILHNYAEYKGMDTSARADLSKYVDANKISDWAIDVVGWANAEGLISGVTNDMLAPQGNATRAQVAAIFERFLTK